MSSHTLHTGLGAARYSDESTRGTEEMRTTSPKSLCAAGRAGVSVKAAGEGGFHSICESDAAESRLHTSAVHFKLPCHATSEQQALTFPLTVITHQGKHTVKKDTCVYASRWGRPSPHIPTQLSCSAPPLGRPHAAVDVATRLCSRICLFISEHAFLPASVVSATYGFKGTISCRCRRNRTTKSSSSRPVSTD